MSEIVKLIGFIIGTSIHTALLFILWRSRQAMRRTRLMTWAILSSSLWHMGNALRLILIALNVLGGSPGDPISQALDIVAFAGLGFLPPLLIHTHLEFYADYAKELKDRAWYRPVVWGLYMPLIVLPGTLRRLWGHPELSALEKLGPYITPFSLGFAGALVVCGFINYRIARHAEDRTERRFFRWLGFIFSLIAAALIVAFVGLGKSSDSSANHLRALVMTSSILPTTLIAYYIFRFNFLELIISRRFVYVLSVSVFLTFYLAAIRTVSGYLEGGPYELPAPIIELILIFAVISVAIPIYIWLDRLISRRINIYGDFTRKLNKEISQVLSLKPRLDFMAAEIARALRLNKVCIVSLSSRTPAKAPAVDAWGGSVEVAPDEAEVRRLAGIILTKRLDIVRWNDALASKAVYNLKDIGFTHVFSLWYETHLAGLMLVDSYPRKYLEDYERLLLALAGPVAGAIEDCKIVEEKIRLEKALIRQEHMANLGKIAAAIAHEIKNPLSSIKTIVQLMKEDGGLGEEYQRDLGFINSEIDRLNKSLIQLLDFSKPVGDNRAAVPLSEMIRNTVQFLSRERGEPAVRMECQVAEGLVLEQANPDSVKEILLNLLINAVQASPPGGTVRINAYAEPEEGPARDRIVLEVSDEGPGVPLELQDKIFEPFFTTKQKGTGLGLAIIKKNIDDLGGEIRLESPVVNQHGTRFRVVFRRSEKR